MTHRLLVIGTGSIGERHLRCFQQLERCELAFCETNEGRRSEVAERYGIDRSFATLNEALGSGEYDAAVIATPAPTHVPFGIRLAKLGMHLLMEKPLSLSFDGVDELERIVTEKRLVVAVGYVHRAHPALMGLKAALDAGRFGKPLEIQTQSGQAFAVLRPAYREVYFADPDQGGGAINDMITHFYNVGDWLVGPIDRIVTDAVHQALDGVTVEDTVHSLTRQGDVMGSYALNLYQKANEVTVTVVCEDGVARAEYAKKRWSWMTEPNGDWHHEAVDVPNVDTWYLRQNAAFLDAMEGEGKVFCTLEESIRTLRVNLASKASLESRTWESCHA